jgi:hypothetical protein
MKTAFVMAAWLVFGLSPASAQVVGGRVTCAGKLFSFDVTPPNHLSFAGHAVTHVGQVFDEAGGYRCRIDRDGLRDRSQPWPCRSGERCRVVGVLAGRTAHNALLILRDGKPVEEPWYFILDVVSAERLE